MTARQAKKVLRLALGGHGFRWGTLLEANRKVWRLRKRAWRDRLTPGWRWGRWDPKPSINPKEVPF